MDAPWDTLYIAVAVTKSVLLPSEAITSISGYVRVHRTGFDGAAVEQMTYKLVTYGNRWTMEVHYNAADQLTSRPCTVHELFS